MIPRTSTMDLPIQMIECKSKDSYEKSNQKQPPSILVGEKMFKDLGSVLSNRTWVMIMKRWVMTKRKLKERGLEKSKQTQIKVVTVTISYKLN